jgi:hypothetical protein
MHRDEVFSGVSVGIAPADGLLAKPVARNRRIGPGHRLELTGFVTVEEWLPDERGPSALRMALLSCHNAD